MKSKTFGLRLLVLGGLVNVLPLRVPSSLMQKRCIMASPFIQMRAPSKSGELSKSEKKAKMIAERKAALAALRAWAELARKKKAWAAEEAAWARAEEARQRSIVEPSQTPTEPELPEVPQALLDLLDTYRELAMVKGRLAIAELRSLITLQQK